MSILAVIISSDIDAASPRKLSEAAFDNACPCLEESMGAYGGYGGGFGRGGTKTTNISIVTGGKTVKLSKLYAILVVTNRGYRCVYIAVL